MKNTHPLGFGGALLAGLVLTALAGCGSGNGTSPITPPIGASASAAPSVPVVIPTPRPSASASAGIPAQVGDFAFESSLQTGRGLDQNIALAAEGTGSTSFALQSVNGFTSPITFPYTVTIKGAYSQVTGTQQAFDSSLATVTVNPATLNALPAGNTTVALAVRASTTLPPLTTVTVDLYAEGGGLKRYPSVGPYSNGGKFIFTTPGLAVSSVNLSRLGTASGSKTTGSAYIQTSGLTGTGTVGITGLPSGVTATFTRLTITLPFAQTGGGSADANVNLAITANQEIAPGTYPVRITVTVNGVTYTSDPANLVVENLARG